MTTAQYHAPIGVITLVSDGYSLKELHFAKHQAETEPRNLSDDRKLQVFEDTRLWLDLYFSGTIPDFIPPINPQGTLFQQKVWRELLAIPYGRTTTYGAIAKRINCRSAQAVGQAIHCNPIAIIIPCHRVIGSDGTLTGYAAGLDIKRELLKLENCPILS
jgi:methylated-DNA-[protein]-cysteine S-methyltransferase